MKFSYDKIYVDQNGKQISKSMLEFLNIIDEIDQKYGAAMLLAIRTILEEIIKKEKMKKLEREKNTKSES